MSDPSSTPKRRQPSAEILRFLDDHRLDHTPDHYASAHRYLFGNDRALEAGVQAIIDGGVRISPAEVEKLGAAVTPEPENDVAPQLDQVTVRVSSVASSSEPSSHVVNAVGCRIAGIAFSCHGRTKSFGLVVTKA